MVEVEDEIAKLKTKIEVLEAEIDDLKEDYKQATREERKDMLGQMIIAARTNLHDLNEELKTFRQPGKEQRTRPFIFMVDIMPSLFIDSYHDTSFTPSQFHIMYYN